MLHKISLMTGCCAAAVAFAAPAWAESVEETIVVTASRTADPADTIGGAAIERETIELVQPADSLELIDRLAGVRAFSKGGAGGPSYLSIRGGEPNFTLVLLDGVRVNDPTNSRGGSFDFGQIDPIALERIELAKGALSAVHGADALSGVVSLQLRRFADGERINLIRGAIDSEGGVGVNAVAGGGWSGGSAIGGLSYGDSGDLTEGSNIERWQGFGRFNQDIGRVTLSAVALHAQSDRSVFPEDSGGPRLAVLREREERETELSLVGVQLAGPEGLWQPRLALNWSRQDDRSNTPPIAPGPVLDGVPGIVSDSRFERSEAIFDQLFRLGIADVAAGVSYIEEDGASAGSLDIGFLLPADFSIERSLASAFAEATLRPLRAVSATFGVRFDDPSSAKSEWTGRAALRWADEASGVGAFASWSEGYKLPSLFALAYPLIANPELRPERSSNFEIGVEKSWAGRGLARLTLFHSRYKDLIDFDAELFTNVNRSRVTAKGVEAEVRAALSPVLRVEANLTYLDTDQPDGVPPLRARPEWEGFAALHWKPAEAVAVEVSAEYGDSFFDSSVPTGLVRLDGRFLVAAAVSYRVSPALSLTLSARNLLGDDYEEAVGFPAPGRVVRLGVAVRP